MWYHPTSVTTYSIEFSKYAIHPKIYFYIQGNSCFTQDFTQNYSSENLSVLHANVLVDTIQS